MILNSDDVTITKKVLEKVKSRNIYFAHMSVGYNILDGILDLTNELNIQSIEEQLITNSPVFLHSIIGENTKPLIKLEDFSNKMTSSIGKNVDTAFLKFCYVDINSSSEIEILFEEYKKTFTKLEKQFPDVTFIHFTLPITSQQKGLKAFIKKMIGRELRGYEDNLKRQEFNSKIREYYTVVFDIAEIESTKPDGTRNKHILDGKEYFSLVPDYTEDGEHLNELGSKLVAQKLILFISNLK